MKVFIEIFEVLLEVVIAGVVVVVGVVVDVVVLGVVVEVLVVVGVVLGVVVVVVGVVVVVVLVVVVVVVLGVVVVVGVVLRVVVVVVGLLVVVVSFGNTKNHEILKAFQFQSFKEVLQLTSIYSQALTTLTSSQVSLVTSLKGPNGLMLLIITYSLGFFSTKTWFRSLLSVQRLSLAAKSVFVASSELSLNNCIPRTKQLTLDLS